MLESSDVYPYDTMPEIQDGHAENKRHTKL